MEAGTPTESRLRALLEASMAIASDLSLDSLLQRLVTTAAELTGARYAALGVIDPSGLQLERFVTTGIDDATHRAIGELPRGRGILGALIQEATPLRLHDLAEDPASVGFPANHPPMHTFLGVPILLRGVAYGNFYLTEKADGEDFTQDDQELVSLLAAQAAVAIENARLYEASTQWSRQLESLNEIGNALATETDVGRLLDLVARRLRELLDARIVAVMLPAGEGELRFAAVAGEGGEAFAGQTMKRADSKSGRVFELGRSERSDAVLDDPEVDHEVVRGLEARTGLWVPLVVRSATIGLIAVHDKLGPDPRFTDNDMRLAETFASRAAVAVDLSQRIARDALRRIVDAQELERRRLARELHDETGQALSSILLGLKALEEKVESEVARAAVSDVRELVVATLHDVRRLAVELRPKVLDDFGLVPALERLTEAFGEQTGIRVRFESGLGPERLPAEVETALYRIVQESLTNIVKHSRARNVSVVLIRKPGAVAAVIEDDGQGFDPAFGARGRLRSRGDAGARRPARRPASDRVGRGGRGDARRGGSPGMSVRVLIVDDHAVFRAGLKLLIDAEDDLEAVGEAGTARDAVFQARALKPDVILMDVVMPDQSGLDVVPTLLHERPETKVLVLSMQDDPQYVRQAFANGASGYILKEAADTEVVAAIREVAGGNNYVHPAVGARLIAAETEEAKRAEEDPLSDREREVLRLLALGHTNQEISAQLFISVRTAETHRAHIMQKLRLSSRAELVRYALEQGVLEQ